MSVIMLLCSGTAEPATTQAAVAQAPAADAMQSLAQLAGSERSSGSSQGQQVAAEAQQLLVLLKAPVSAAANAAPGLRVLCASSNAHAREAGAEALRSLHRPSTTSIQQFKGLLQQVSEGDATQQLQAAQQLAVCASGGNEAMLGAAGEACIVLLGCLQAHACPAQVADIHEAALRWGEHAHC